MKIYIMIKKIHLIGFLAGFILLVLASCVAKQPLPNLSVETQEAYRNSKQFSVNTEKEEGDWHAFFQDDSLQYIIQEVLDHNLDLAMTNHSLSIYKEYQKQANLSGLPTLNLGLSFKRDQFSQKGLYGDQGTQIEQIIGSKRIEDYTTNFTLNWEVDFWEKNKNRKNVAYYARLRTEMQIKDSQTQLTASAAQAYSYIQVLKKQLIVNQNNIRLNDSIVRMMKVQQLNGLVTQLAVQQSERLYYTAASQIPGLIKAVQIHENYLNTLMGRPSQALNIVVDRTIINPKIISVGLPADLLSRRADVKAKEYEVMSAYAELGIAKANLYPSINLSVNSGLNSIQLSDWLNPAALFGQVIGQMTQPIFNQRKNKTAVNVQKHKVEQKVLDFKKTYMVASNQVSDALVEVQQIEEGLAITKNENDLLIRSLKNAQLLFKNGLANYLEVLTIQQNLLQNELNTAQLQGELDTAFIKLYTSLGGAQ